MKYPLSISASASFLCIFVLGTPAGRAEPLPQDAPAGPAAFERHAERLKEAYFLPGLGTLLQTRDLTLARDLCAGLRPLELSVLPPKIEGEISLYTEHDPGLGFTWYGQLRDLELELFPGEYTVTITCPGFERWQKIIRVERDKTQAPYSVSVVIQNPPGKVIILCEPGAAIYDGKGTALGRTGSTPFELPAGRHMLFLRAPGFREYPIEMDVSSLETARRTVFLEKASGVLEISATTEPSPDRIEPDPPEPDIARVHLYRMNEDGTRTRVKNELSALPVQVPDLQPGEYLVQVALKQFWTEGEEQFSIRAGEIHTMHLVARPWPRAVFTSNAENAQIFAVREHGEKFLGMANETLFFKPNTIHHLEIRAPGYHSHKYAFRATAPHEFRKEHIGLSPIATP